MALTNQIAGLAVSLVLASCASSTPPSNAPEGSASAPVDSEADQSAAAAPKDGSESTEQVAEADGKTASEEPAEAASKGEEAPAPRPLMRDTGVETRTTIVIQKIVAQNRQLVRDCYETSLKTHPGLKGDLTLKFVVDPVGNVSTAELNVERSTLTEPSLVQCAVAAIRSIKFPESSRGFESKVNYPFNLNP